MATPSSEGYTQGWLEYEKVLGARPLLSGTPQDIVAQFNGLGEALAAQAPPPDTSVKTEDKKADGVSVRIYTPPAASEKKLPVVVYYHGGGFLVGNLDSEDAWCRVISKNIPAIVVSVDYRTTQTDKWPAQFDDSMTAYKWAWHNAGSIGGDQSKVYTSGASAGGGLALTVADQCIKAGIGSHVQGVIAVVPMAAHPSSIASEYKSQYTSYTDNKSGVPIIDADTMKTFVDVAGIDPKDEKVFVTLSKDLAKFPPTYICTCEKDPLRDDGKVLEAMLKKDGVKTKSDYYEGVPHYFWMFPGIQGGEEFFANWVKGAQWVISQS